MWQLQEADAKAVHAEEQGYGLERNGGYGLAL
jgi:hypothetical protein